MRAADIVALKSCLVVGPSIRARAPLRWFASWSGDSGWGRDAVLGGGGVPGGGGASAPTRPTPKIMPRHRVGMCPR
jgi:hypothetical protein